MTEDDQYPDGAQVLSGGLVWCYDATRRMWDGRRVEDGPVVKRRRHGSRASDSLWFRHRHGMSTREFIARHRAKQ